MDSVTHVVLIRQYEQQCLIRGTGYSDHQRFPYSSQSINTNTSNLPDRSSTYDGSVRLDDQWWLPLLPVQIRTRPDGRLQTPRHDDNYPHRSNTKNPSYRTRNSHHLVALIDHSTILVTCIHALSYENDRVEKTSAVGLNASSDQTVGPKTAQPLKSKRKKSHPSLPINKTGKHYPRPPKG